LAEIAMGWSDAEFLAEVQRRFGFRLGRFLKVGRRAAYPLSLTRALQTSAGRCVIVGNAAQGLHPVAGMGFNLGLRDVASLAELVAEHGSGADGCVVVRVRCLARRRSAPDHRLYRRTRAAFFQSLRSGARAREIWRC
jgi:2-octaprenyl-6-methoxyphenol hydroxylase